ncbi:MAG: shikimate kinase [Flavobacteriales bacterium]
MKKPNLIFVIGFMASGKSTFGKRIAKELGYSFIDADKAIEKQEGKTITEIFSERGEQYFRKLEMKFLKSLSELSENTVISTGGGMACNQYRLNRMLNSGRVIYLEIDTKSVINRLKNAKTRRPILEGLSNQELEKKISSLLHKRGKYYEQAHQIVNSLHSKKVKAKELI